MPQVTFQSQYKLLTSPVRYTLFHPTLHSLFQTEEMLLLNTYACLHIWKELSLFLRLAWKKLMTTVTAKHKTKANKKTILAGKHLPFSCVAHLVFSFQVTVIAKQKNSD